MNTEEYGRMAAAEESHWWYRALHAHVDGACTRFGLDGGRIADVGCGTGAMAAQLAGRAMVVGVDFAPEGLALCRRRGLTHLARADAMNLPLESGGFDVVLLLDVLYHKNIQEPLAVLREAKRVLAPGGVVIVNVPAYQWLYSSHDVAVHTGRRFTRGAVLRLLQEAGFCIEFASYWNTILFPAIAAVRLMRRWVPPAGSDVHEHTPPWINRALGGLMALERWCMGRTSLPFGVSILAVGRRPPE